MKVWHDWDSGPFEIVTNQRPSHGRIIESEMSEEDYRDYEAIMERFDEWQARLEKIRKSLTK